METNILNFAWFLVLSVYCFYKICMGVKCLSEASITHRVFTGISFILEVTFYMVAIYMIQAVNCLQG